MSRWGNCYSEQDQTVNFNQIINQHPDAYQLLQLQGFVQNVKSKSSKFTKKIIEPECQHILHELLEIAINPDLYMQKNNKNLDRKMTNAAVEIMSNLSEKFVEAVFDGDDQKEDQVIQQEKQFPIMTFIFKTLTPSVQQTGLAYLSKIITPFIYQRPAQMLKVLNKGTIHMLVMYFWSPSIAELVNKIIQAQGQSDFYQHQKLDFFRNFCHEFSTVKDQNHLEKIMESFRGVIDSLVEKHEDKYERSKYAELLQKIIAQEDNFAFLLGHIEKYNHHPTIKAQILNCIYSYLRIHEPLKEGSKINQEEGKNIENIKLNQNFKNRLKHYLQNHPPQEFASPFRKELLQFYKIVKMLLILDPDSCQQIITKQFITDSFTLMKQDEHNNILHNFQKDVLMAAVKHSKTVCNIVQNEVGFDVTLRSNLSQNNSKISYQTQLFLIGEAVKEKAKEDSTLSENWNDLDSPLQNKRQFFSVLIGGKPRSNSNNWDDFQNELILKPLEQKSEEPVLTTANKPEKPEKHAYQMVTRLDQLEGTEVLSQDEEDPFTTKNTQNSHYIDDLGLPDLPLDSDRSEDEVNNLKLESSEQLPDLLENSSVSKKKEANALENIRTEEPKKNTQVENSQNKNEQNLEMPKPAARANSIVSILVPGQSSKAKEEKDTENKVISPNKLDAIQQEVPTLSESVNIEEVPEQQEGHESEPQEEKGELATEENNESPVSIWIQNQAEKKTQVVEEEKGKPAYDKTYDPAKENNIEQKIDEPAVVVTEPTVEEDKKDEEKPVEIIEEKAEQIKQQKTEQPKQQPQIQPEQPKEEQKLAQHPQLQEAPRQQYTPPEPPTQPEPSDQPQAQFQPSESTPGRQQIQKLLISRYNLTL